VPKGVSDKKKKSSRPECPLFLVQVRSDTKQLFFHSFVPSTKIQSRLSKVFARRFLGGGNWKRFWLGDVVGMLLGGRRMQQPTINGSGESD
jgi:hypothetical protein